MALFSVDTPLTIGISEIRRTREKNHRTEEWSHLFCYIGQKAKKEHAIGFLVKKEPTENIYSVNERVACY